MTAASRSQLTRIAVLFANHGIHDRTDRLRLVADHTDRYVHTMATLTTTEADTLIHRLANLPPDCDLRTHLARLVAAEEQTARQAAR